MCDCLVALPAATGSVALFAKNSDRPPGEAQRLEWHPPRNGGSRRRVTHVEIEDAPSLGVLGSRPAWMWGFEHGVNEAGVACGNETIYTVLDPRGHPPALTGMDLVRLALERSTTAEAAVQTIADLLERHGQGGSGHRDADRPYWSSFLVADPGDAWVVETSGRLWAAEQVTRTRAISNRTTIEGFDRAHRHPRQPVEDLVDPRLDASRALLSAEPVTQAALRTHLRSHDQSASGWTICMHVPEVEQTTASIIAELRHGRSRVAVLAGSPCASVYVPLHVGRSLGRPVAWERFAALADTMRPVHQRAGAAAGWRSALDELEQGLEVDARDDDTWADEAWARVDAALRGLGA